MSMGLKERYKYIATQVGYAGSTYINLCGCVPNMHLEIPLYISSENSPTNLSLMFTLSEKDLGQAFGYDEYFGKGSQINYYGRIYKQVDPPCRSLVNFDGSIDVYEAVVDENHTYYNEKTQLKIIDGGDIYEVEDKLGNKKTYDSHHLRYPEEIKFKNGKKYF